jgi:hypothetical protein
MIKKERPLQGSPSPDEILREAELVEEQPPYVCLSEYAPAFVVLQMKGMSWVDIHRWATERGIDRSKQSIVKATRDYADKAGIELRGYS